MKSLPKQFPVLVNWRFYLLIGLPVLLLPLLFIADEDVVVYKGSLRDSSKFKCAYVIILMAAFWMVEALPLPITALLPVVFFPLLGINSTAGVASNYMKETTMMFIGGLIIALAVEHCNLHKRVALKVMGIIGGSPIKLMLGIMLTTMVLSMWMSNTATTAMMVPIVLAVLETLYQDEDCPASTSTSSPNLNTPQQKAVSFESVNAGNLGNDVIPVCTNFKSEGRAQRLQMEKMYLLAVAYSSNIGGTGVVTGSGPNLFVFELIQTHNIGQNGKYTDLTFATWMIFNIPPMIVNVIIAWMYLTLVFLGLPDWCRFGRKSSPNSNQSNQDTVSKMLKQKYTDLGRITFHEIGVSVIFLLAVMLWVFRDPKFVTGWSDYFPNARIGDSTAAILAVLLLFIVPKDLSSFSGGPTGAMLDWKYVQDGLPWGVVILLGGGFALSEASDISGLSAWIGGKLVGLQGLDEKFILLIVMLLTAMITEVASNTATANILIPILLALSKNLDIHPLYMSLPAAICCSYAFMLPVATPPNAIVFGASRGRMRIIDMIKTGGFLNCSCVLVLFLFNITFGSILFNYSDYVYANSTAVMTQ